LAWGAAATLALLVVIVGVWLMQPSERIADDRIADATLQPVSEPAQQAKLASQLALAGEIRTAPVGAVRDRSTSAAVVAAPVATHSLTGRAGSGYLHALAAVPVAAMEAPATPFPSPLNALVPVANGARATDRPSDVRAAEAGRVPQDMTTRRAPEERRTVPAARSVAATYRLQPVYERGGPFLAVAARVVPEVEPSSAALASSLELPSPDAEEPPPELPVAAAPEPQPPPPRQASVSSQASVPSNASGASHAGSKSRAVRANPRYHQPVRYSRRPRRAPQYEPAPAPAPQRPFIVLVEPPKTPAARMFEAWAKEWTNAAQQGLRPPSRAQ
jgi:hypothetical protein